MDEDLKTYHPKARNFSCNPNVKIFVHSDSTEEKARIVEQQSAKKALQQRWNNLHNEKNQVKSISTNRWQSSIDALSRRLAKLNSLDSNRSWSSTEADAATSSYNNNNNNNNNNQIDIDPPVSGYHHDKTATQQSTGSRDPETKLTSENGEYRKRQHRLVRQLTQDIIDDDRLDEEEFFETSSIDASMLRQYRFSSNINDDDVLDLNQSMLDIRKDRNRPSLASIATVFEEDLLDDRQGMNRNDAQFTQNEARQSFDGSILSEFVSRSVEDDNKSRSSRVLNPSVDNLSFKRRGARGGSVKRTTKNSKRSNNLSLYDSDNRRRRRQRSPLSTVGSSLFCGVLQQSTVSSHQSSSRSRKMRANQNRWARKFKLKKRHKSIMKFQLSIMNSRFISGSLKLDKDLQSFLPKKRLSAKKLEDRIHVMKKYQVLATIEYRFASRYETYSCKHALLEANQEKNNHKRCIPYDYNRVVLKTLPNQPNSDYINASHIDSYLKPNAYIATQGPNENTINDFWRMVWEQKTFVIVMLTKVFDFIKVMCNQYWPVEVNKPEAYGNIEVTLLYEEPLADFVIRTIKLRKIKSNKETEIETGMATTITTSKKDDPRSPSPSISYDYQVMKEPQELSQNLRPNLYLHPLQKIADNPTGFTANQQLSNSMVSIMSNSLNGDIPNSPTPTSPRTPSSAGLDRSSATRRAVKKKKRTKVKNPRPQRTQFLVPSESQLLDEDDNEDDDDDSNQEDANFFSSKTNENDEIDENLIDAEILDNNNQSPTSLQSKNPNSTNKLRNTKTSNYNSSIGEQKVKKKKSSRERIIYQFHYHSWASHTCPFISSLLHFRRRVRICMDEMSKSGKIGPTVVHCNDGCGRTGTYLCIDANLELADEDNCYDVYNYTKKLRQSRKLLIENLEQYKFVYNTLQEAMFCGKTWFPVSDLHKRLKFKSKRNRETKLNEYQLEYEKIIQMTGKFSIGDCAGGHRVENRLKNRDVSTVPPDNFRPYLTSFQTNDSTDYINAVFVDGYTRSKEYIVTEWPLHRTISDFWSLIYDHDCNSVILLANPPESSTYPSFLPSERELRRRFGPVFSAEMVSYVHYQNIKSWIYTISKKIVSLTEVMAGVKSEPKTTQVFQITCWPQGHRVPTSTNALVELMNMVERWRQRTTYGPVCVVSLNGKSRAGVYCAANVAIEQVVQHNEVDVFQAVRTVRRYRPQLIENMTEYKYCYDLILHYVLHYLNQD